MIFDTHCHGYWNGLAHRQDEVRRNMQDAGVLRSVHVGTDLNTSQKALDLSRAWGDSTWCSFGIHPTSSQGMPENSVGDCTARLEGLIRNNRDKVVAVGETGFDFYHLTPGREARQIAAQKEFFRAQAELAGRLELPAIIHTRDAAKETLALVKESGLRRAVIHCFSENAAFALELMEWSRDIYFSFSGILTYKKATAVQETARALPLERILVETDAPFLTPQAVRDTFPVNEPAFTRHVMDCLKKIRSEPGGLVEQTVWENANRFFGLN
jgi:TatD DNase family protein